MLSPSLTTQTLESFVPDILAVSMSAQNLFGLPWFTNSTLVALVVLVLVLTAFRKATKNMQLVPSGFQNLFEALIELLYDNVEQIVGPKVAKQCFHLILTIFVYVLVANWFGLLPGVGTIGGMNSDGYVVEPLIRPATADLNMTLGIALSFMVLWIILTVKEAGIIGFLKHTFCPPGGIVGFMKYALIPLFMFVGVIEVVSIALRPVSLSLRLFGNVFAGETLLHEMGGLVKAGGPIVEFICRVLVPLPFYFMEILVGALQAMVFALLCTIYIQLSTAHDEEEGH
ncbi:MAG: F0F1 ATP synthase subunit A [Verrucomicrobiales bacterium]|jgi:F-type H+-transporting ATPase subunit a|nr:F0F1 ATP synthase subunit A [Verrucomicrobiales bacterium]